MKRLMARQFQHGDTIVEVLIALAVVMVVLIGGFVVSQKSSIGVRSGQERAEMLEILQAQVEQVRSLALAQRTDSGGIFASGDFCVQSDNSGALARVPASDPACHDIQQRYNVTISYDTSLKVFTFVGTWPTLGGGTGKEILTYRVYAGKPISLAPKAPRADAASFIS